MSPGHSAGTNPSASASLSFLGSIARANLRSVLSPVPSLAHHRANRALQPSKIRLLSNMSVQYISFQSYVRGMDGVQKTREVSFELFPSEVRCDKYGPLKPDADRVLLLVAYSPPMRTRIGKCACFDVPRIS